MQQGGRDEHAPSARQRTVLLVDDEAAVRAVLLGVLARSGHRVLDAADAEEALVRAAESGLRLDVLVSDLVMPGVGGRELARRLRADRPDLKVVFISGFPPPEFRPEELDKNARFLSKPLVPADLVAALASLLENHVGQTEPACSCTNPTTPR